MENSIFTCCKSSQKLRFERFHICSWEFRDGTALFEVGGEVDVSKLSETHLVSFDIVFPWKLKGDSIKDMYQKLSDPDNCRFIFNDSVRKAIYLEEGRGVKGVVYEFDQRDRLSVLPVSLKINNDGRVVSVEIDLRGHRGVLNGENVNVYFRLCLDVRGDEICLKKMGIGKSAVIYDLKINERRNLPDPSVYDMMDSDLCQISNCFCFNIVPNDYDIVFLESSSLKNIRTLEYNSFNKYLGDERIKKDDLLVVFNKKKNLSSYGFFSIFSKERIGPAQFVVAVFINLLCGVVLSMPDAFPRFDLNDIFYMNFWINISYKVYFVVIIALVALVYLLWPNIKNLKKVFL